MIKVVPHQIKCHQHQHILPRRLVFWGKITCYTIHNKKQKNHIIMIWFFITYFFIFKYIFYLFFLILMTMFFFSFVCRRLSPFGLIWYKEWFLIFDFIDCSPHFLLLDEKFVLNKNTNAKHLHYFFHCFYHFMFLLWFYEYTNRQTHIQYHSKQKCNFIFCWVDAKEEEEVKIFEYFITHHHYYT